MFRANKPVICYSKEQHFIIFKVGVQRLMEVGSLHEILQAPAVIQTLLAEFSAITEYRTLRDSLPRRLAHLLNCRCILFYQRVGETLQFAAGSYDDKPGWSAALLAVVHINPISLNSTVAESCAWRERHAIVEPITHPTRVAIPLIYRQRCIGVLVAIRGGTNAPLYTSHPWHENEIPVLETVASVVALLLENTRLLERDRERIHELSLLNSISRQMSTAWYEAERLHAVVIQRMREISTAEQCAVVEIAAPFDKTSWIPRALHQAIVQRFDTQRSLQAFVVERPYSGQDTLARLCLDLLPANMQTFFVIPLLSARSTGNSAPMLHALHEPTTPATTLLGYIAGGCHRPWKLHREEVLLLQVLAGQASAVLENITLVAEVIEARNEARKLLRQVLDDQRFKELILASIPSGLITTDSAGCITTCNRAAQTMLGYSAYEVIGQPLSTILSGYTPDHASTTNHTISATPLTVDMVYSALSATERQHETLVTSDRQGQEIVLAVDMVPLSDEHGGRVGMLLAFNDTTSIYRLEEEKRRLDRLASLGEMAANVAHEVRNPLASIKTSMQMLLSDLEESVSVPVGEYEQADARAERDESMQESIEVVLKEVERLDCIVRDLLLFARPRQLHRAKCEPRKISEHVLRMLQGQLAEAHVEVHSVYGEESPLWADVGQVEQVLLNLYVNAIQAMPDGGILTVATRIVQANLPSRDPRYGLIAHWFEISISDTGVGLTPEQLKRIFQPFFTTKAHGMGLGLPITRRLIEDHGGSIEVESQFGFGTTVLVRFPLHAQEEKEMGVV